MVSRTKIFSVIGAWMLLTSLTWAAGFEIRDIRVDGLQRISAGTLFNYLPVKVGDKLGADDPPKIVRALYKTGFFTDVQVQQEGNVLVIQVQERPAIGSVEITGNKEISTEDLNKALKDIGMAEGRVFNRSILDKIEQELRRQYLARGKYAMELTSTVSPLERNRVGIKIDISEGVAARIKQINIIGASAFDKDDLLDNFQLGTGGWLSAFTKNDQYSKQKLSADLETLRSYYLDRGYVNFEIESTQVSITPDKKDIFITVVIKEGEVYTLNDIKLAGDLVVPKEDLFSMVHLRRGDVFSRKAVTESAERIGMALGNQGYAFANINSIPDIDKENKQVGITFFVDPGKRVYVRRVEIKGNTRTRDEVLRREMRQLESAWFSTDLIKRSRERLQRLGFFDEVNIETPAVAGSADEVDVKVSVKEKPAGNFLAGVGYSQSEGVLFSTSITQNNFLGTGKRVSLAFNTSSSNTIYRVGYTNPYYTIDGISRGFNLSYQRTDYSELNSIDYLTDVGNASVNFGLPITDTSRVGLEFGYVFTKLRPQESVVAKDFVDANGDIFNDLRITLDWKRDSRDSATLPTYGGQQTASMTVSSPLGLGDLAFYRLNYRHQQYFPLGGKFVLLMGANLGYGNGLGDQDELPFFENFFAGGSKTVRGFKDNTLGPRETSDPESDPIGGNLKLVGNLELIFPPLLSGQFEKTTRFSAFVDAGNVWATEGDTSRESVGFDWADLRYSAGVAATWISPLGSLTVSLAQPINQKEGDEDEIFQFSLGTQF